MTARPRFRDILADPTLALMLALGFSSGLPFLLVLGTQAARLAEAKVPIEQIGLISWVGLCYSLKFLWAPAIDALDVPGLARLLGRRRAWLLVAQAGVVAGLVALAFADPAASLADLIVRAAFTAFAAATQDVVIDGWRIDVAPPERQGLMAATANFGYRLGLLAAGAGALYLADFASWRTAYLVMAALMGVGIVAGLVSPRLAERPRPQGDTAAARLFAPVTDLWRRYGAWLAAILLLVALYRLPDFLSGVMANPLYIDLGFSKSDIATMSKVYGVWIGIAGAFAGGYAITRVGLMPALLAGGLAAAASHLCLALLAATGKSLALLALAVSVENFAGNFAGAALIAYMSSLTSPGLAASQYALLSSLYALLGKFLGGFSGFAVKQVGFAGFFAATSLIGLPVAALCLLVWARQRAAARPSRLAALAPQDEGDGAAGKPNPSR
jgi:PAT family beta-lactamase induction signal transducer AmpG